MPDLTVQFSTVAPSTSSANVFYLVRSGTGFDFYAADKTGTLLQINASGAKTKAELDAGPNNQGDMAFDGLNYLLLCAVAGTPGTLVKVPLLAYSP